MKTIAIPAPITTIEFRPHKASAPFFDGNGRGDDAIEFPLSVDAADDQGRQVQVVIKDVNARQVAHMLGAQTSSMSLKIARALVDAANHAVLGLPLSLRISDDLQAMAEQKYSFPLRVQMFNFGGSIPMITDGTTFIARLSYPRDMDLRVQFGNLLAASLNEVAALYGVFKPAGGQKGQNPSSSRSRTRLDLDDGSKPFG
jgi:hypothetical protein